MNENAAIQSIVTALRTNEASLIEDLEQNGVAKRLLFLSETVLASPTGYYAVKVHCSDLTERDHVTPAAFNSNSATPYRTLYEITIYAGDYAIPDNTLDGGYPGRTAHRNFRTFTDRIVKRIRRDQEWFPTAIASPKFRLIVTQQEGRVVRKKMIQPIETVDPYPLIGAEISFTIVGCDVG